MHYYTFHVGDYRAATAHLTNEQDLAYRRLLDMYYDTEAPIPLDTEWVARRLRLGSDVVAVVLDDMFTRTDEGWRNARCDDEIARFIARVERNRENGKSGGRKGCKKQEPSGFPVGSQSEPTLGTGYMGTGSLDTSVPSEKKGTAHSDDGFAEFWAAYQKATKKPKALSAWTRLTKADRAAAMAGVPAYVAATPDKQFRRDAVTWLNQRGWEDEIVTSNGGRKKDSDDRFHQKFVPGMYGEGIQDI